MPLAELAGTDCDRLGAAWIDARLQNGKGNRNDICTDEGEPDSLISTRSGSCLDGSLISTSTQEKFNS
jgi:hypothetical protein